MPIYTQVCAQRAKGTYEVPSDSSNKIYTVTYGDGGMPSCTCVAYAIKRNRDKKQLGLAGKGSDHPGWCKHLDWVVDNVCQWSAADADAAPQRTDGVCPDCNGLTVHLKDGKELDESGHTFEVAIHLRITLPNKTAALSLLTGDFATSLAQALNEDWGTMDVALENEDDLRMELQKVLNA